MGKTRIVFRNPGSMARGTTPPPTGLITQVFFARCLVSVLVAHNRGLARAMDQSALCQVLGSWFSEADRIMQKHGSAAQKYIGDAAMAVHFDPDRFFSERFGRPRFAYYPFISPGLRPGISLTADRTLWLTPISRCAASEVHQ